MSYNDWQRLVTVKCLDDYDWYIFIGDQKIGAPMERRETMWLAFWLPGALDDILKAVNSG